MRTPDRFLNGIWAFSMKREWVTVDPVLLVDRPRTSRSAHRRLPFLTNEDLATVIRAVPEDELGAVERPLYACAAMTGLRQGALIGLRWLDVDWVNGRILVAESYTRGAFDSPKSCRGRSVPLSDRLAGEPERYFQRTRWRGDRDPVFAHPMTGHVLDASKLRKRVRNAVARAAVEDLTFHELRHTFSTKMAAAGAPLRTIQAWMGHADASTTEIYAHYARDPAGEAGYARKAFGDAIAAPVLAEPSRLPGL